MHPTPEELSIASGCFTLGGVMLGAVINNLTSRAQERREIRRRRYESFDHQLSEGSKRIIQECSELYVEITREVLVKIDEFPHKRLEEEDRYPRASKEELLNTNARLRLWGSPAVLKAYANYVDTLRVWEWRMGKMRSLNGEQLPEATPEERINDQRQAAEEAEASGLELVEAMRSEINRRITY